MLCMNIYTFANAKTQSDDDEKVKIEWDSTTLTETKSFDFICTPGPDPAEAQFCGRSDGDFVLAKNQKIAIQLTKSTALKRCFVFILSKTKHATDKSGFTAAQSVCTDGKKKVMWKNNTNKNVAVQLKIVDPDYYDNPDSNISEVIYFPK